MSNDSERVTLLHKGARTAVSLVSRHGRQWVEKTLLPFADVAPERRSLAREARLHAVCAGPGIVPLRDAEETARVQGLEQCRSFCREYVEGFSVRQYLLAPREHVLPEGLDSGISVAAALASILSHWEHKKDARGRALEITHRDVSPGNVLIDARGFVWLNDFGLAHLRSRETLDHEELSQGTPAYLSPEQKHGDAVGPRSDVFQCAFLLYLLDEAASGPTRMASDDNNSERLRRARLVLQQRYETPVLTSCLAESPHDRPRVSALRDVLRKLHGRAAN